MRLNRRALLAVAGSAAVAGCSGGGAGARESSETRESRGRPLTEERFEEEFTALVEKYGLGREQYELSFDGRARAVVEYETDPAHRRAVRATFRNAYTTLVKDYRVVRNLEGHVRRAEGEPPKWYRWTIERAAAEAFVGDVITEEEYVAKIDETVTDWGEPLPANAFRERFGEHAEAAGLAADDYELTVESADVAVVEYATTEKGRVVDRGKFRGAYTALVEETRVARNLEGRVRREASGERWYTWEIETEWAEAYAAGELSKEEYVSKIDETVETWVAPMDAEAFATRFEKLAAERGLSSEAFSLSVESESTASVEYAADGRPKTPTRVTLRETYTALVDGYDVGRSLEGNVTRAGTGERWYRWTLETGWVERYLAGEWTEARLEERITGTVEPWGGE